MNIAIGNLKYIAHHMETINTGKIYPVDNAPINPQREAKQK